MQFTDPDPDWNCVTLSLVIRTNKNDPGLCQRPKGFGNLGWFNTGRWQEAIGGLLG